MSEEEVRIGWRLDQFPPCRMTPFLLSSLTERQIQTQEMFMFVLTVAVFFGIIFLSFMVTHVKSRRIKIAKEKLAALDVLPGLTIYKNPDGAKLVQEKQKNIPGGAATVVIIFGVLALVAYVLASEFDLPGEVGFQRRLMKSIEGTRMSSQSTSLKSDREVLSPMHELEIGFIYNHWPARFPLRNLNFVSETNILGQRVIDTHCSSDDAGRSARVIATTYDFWTTPAKEDIILCADLPFQRTENNFSFYLWSDPVGTGSFRAPATIIDEALQRWETTGPRDVFPRFEISVTAVTAYQLSVFIIDYMIPPTRIHKVRVDSIVTYENITSNNACRNPIAQFTITGQVWEIDGIYITGLSTVIISAIGAAGTLFGARTWIKSGFEWISKQYNVSTKKRKSITILGYSVQTIVGALAAAGAVIGTFILRSDFTNHMINSNAANFFLINCLAGLVWIYWIFSTVVFVRNMREFAAEKNKNSSVEIIEHEDGDYVKLEDV